MFPWCYYKAQSLGIYDASRPGDSSFVPSSLFLLHSVSSFRSLPPCSFSVVLCEAAMLLLR